MKKKPNDRWVPHIVKEGARYHVVSYHSDRGAVCSEPNCEVNRWPAERPDKPFFKKPSPPEEASTQIYGDEGENIDEDPAEYWARGEIWGD